MIWTEIFMHWWHLKTDGSADFLMHDNAKINSTSATEVYFIPRMHSFFILCSMRACSSILPPLLTGSIKKQNKSRRWTPMYLWL